MMYWSPIFPNVYKTTFYKSKIQIFAKLSSSLISVSSLALFSINPSDMWLLQHPSKIHSRLYLPPETYGLNLDDFKFNDFNLDDFNSDDFNFDDLITSIWMTLKHEFLMTSILMTSILMTSTLITSTLMIDRCQCNID